LFNGELSRDAPTASGVQRRATNQYEFTILAVAGLFVVARGPFVFAATGRVALLLAMGLPGIVLLALRARHRDGSAVALAVFLGAIVCSALLSPGPVQSFKASLGSSTTVLVYALSGGWWAVGTTMSVAGRRALPWVLVTGGGLNLLVGLLQIVMPIEGGSLATYPGRASGLLVNPVYYGSFCAGLTCWAMATAASRPKTWATLLVGALSFATALSGSRIAVVVVGASAVVWLAALRLSKGSLWVALSTFAGVASANLFTAVLGRLDDRYATGSGVVNRFQSGESASARAHIWAYGLEALGERPLFGWGLNHFGTATWPRYSSEFVAETQWNDATQQWTDPHNIVVHLLTTAGLIGTIAAAWFVIVSLRRRPHVPLLALSAGIAGTWVLQPTTIETLPIALLAFGAALSHRVKALDNRASPRSLRFQRGALGAALAIGLTTAALVVVMDRRLDAAADSRRLGAIEDAADWFYRDAAVTEFVAGHFEAANRQGLDTADDAVRWSQSTVAINPHSPMARNELAIRQYLAGDLAGMKATLDSALALQRWNPTSHRLLVIYASAAGNEQLLETARSHACQLRLTVCSPTEGVEDERLLVGRG
jgi:O-antigen ligase